MANFPNPSQRLILAVGLALATFGTPTAVMATDGQRFHSGRRVHQW